MNERSFCRAVSSTLAEEATARSAEREKTLSMVVFVVSSEEGWDVVVYLVI